MKYTFNDTVTTESVGEFVANQVIHEMTKSDLNRAMYGSLWEGHLEERKRNAMLRTHSYKMEKKETL